MPNLENSKMDIDKIIKKVNNLNEYIAATQEIANIIQNSKIQFNLSTVLSLKKVRALEIEYFNKCEERGAAVIIFEHIANQPPSKTWEFLGKELVNLLQYWLDAMRKHLIKQNYNWWNFMIQLLKFLKLIRLKDKTLPDILVNHTAECLLDLATATEPNGLQRLEILYCLNLCSAEASRDIRKTLKDNFDPYFTKLSNRLATCSNLPTQFSILETLLRWLVPRHDPAVRHAAALKWFPEDVFGWRPVQVFLERPWQYFFQDARDFLNAFNDKADLVASVLCRKLVIGTVIVVSSAEKRETWLDVNTVDNSVSILLDPRILDGLGISTDSWDILILADDNILDIQLFRDSSEVVLSIQTCQIPVLLSSGVQLGDGCQLRAVIATKNIDKLDKVLRSQFMPRYKSSVDLEKMSYSMSPVDNMDKRTVLTEDDTRFSHPVETQKRKRSGYMVRSRNPPCQSPSTASTSSLAYLHEKLAQLPRYKFEKEAVNVCALPNLSTVTEISETDDRQSVTSTSTIKLARPYGFGQKTYKNKNSQSDSEAQINQKLGRYLSPSTKDNQNSTSCLLVATIGSDESVINDTLERITKSKDYQGDNIVDLLVQEALKNEKDKLVDSGINTCDNKKSLEQNQTNEVLNDTLVDCNNFNNNSETNQDSKKTCTVISNTTTDESNDVVYDTPLNFVNVRKRQRFIENKIAEDNPINPSTFDVKVVENFFNQHLNENHRGDIVISPTLARKINDTSSESDQFEDCLLSTDNNAGLITTDDNEHVELFDIQDIDIIECLNNIVDIVCNDLEKCTAILNKDCNNMNIVDNESSNVVKNVTNIGKTMTDNSENVEPKGKATRGIKLKFNSKRVMKTRGNAKKRKAKLDKETVPKMSPIIETKDESDEKHAKTITTPESKKDSTNSDTLDLPLARRKRKLYSPRDENVNVQNERKAISDGDEDNEFKTSKPINKYTATSYKDIEKDRAKQLKRSSTRRSRTKSERTPSPKTKEMNDLFDHLKDRVESNDPVILADKTNIKDLAVYNITSDSEDDDFKNKKLEIKKRISSTTVASADSSMTRRGRTTTRINYSESKSSDEKPKKKVSKPKRNTRIKKQTNTKNIIKELDLVDEKMRKQAQEDLNASFVAENVNQSPDKDPELVLNERPVLEPIADETVSKSKLVQKTMKKEKRHKIETLSLRKEQVKRAESEANGNRTESPLPSLVIEKMPTNNDEDLLSVNMLQKMKQIYENGFETTCNNDTNTTHNLLSDVDKTNISLHDIRNEELIRIEDYEDITNDNNNKLEVNTTVLKLSQKVIDVEENITTKRKPNEVPNIRKTEHNNRTKIINSDNEEKIDVIEIMETDEVKSDRSIATVGKSPITAHGDDNEDPPDSRLLWQKLKPRNLEMEYLDDSIKDYYNKLSKVVHDLPSIKPVSNDSVRERAESNSSELKSPVVSVTRLSINDISKWLPSRRSSEIESSCSSPKSITKVKNQMINYSEGCNKAFPGKYRLRQRKLQDTSSESSQKRKSKRLEHKNVSYDECKSENSDSDNKSTVITVSKKVKRNFKEQSNSQSDEEKINVIKLLQSRRQTETRLKRINNDSSTPAHTQDSNRTKTTQPKTYRKSLISPIKMFDEIYPSSKLDSTKNTSSNIKEKRVDEKPRRDYKDTLQISSPDSKMSTSTKIITTKSVRSKKKNALEINAAKRMKLDDTEVSLSESGPSISSVNDWFKKIDPISRDQCVNASLTETIQNVMEKLDTTLEEINQNTSMNFIHMFVDAQKELTSVRQKRRQMFREVASDIITEVVKVIDSKFADLDERSQEMDLEFMEQLKKQASVFIREDCKKKRVMVNLLKEDVQVALDHTNKKISRRS